MGGGSVSGAILLTGAAGFLGSEIARRLVTDTDHALIALVRVSDPATAARRLSRAWWDWPELVEALGGVCSTSRVQVLCGDVALPQLGLDDSAYQDLVHRVTHIIHAAADLRVNAPLAELRRTNVQGTANVLALARAARQHHGLERLAHISTAYVAGRRTGLVPEDALTDEWGFSSAYECSKLEGERLVQAAKSELPIVVFRPGMIVGDARSGAIKTFNTVYFPLRLYLTGQLWVVPARPAQRVNMIPVNEVAHAVVRLTFEPAAEGLNFHLTAPYESLPTARELVEVVREWARAQLGLRLPRLLFVPLPVRRRYRPERERPSAHAGTLASLQALLPYFDERMRFRRDNVDRLLGPYTCEWRTFLPRLLAYAVDMGFLHRSERTVHEQVLYRLGRVHRPMSFRDVAEGRIVTRTAAEVRQEMLAATGALRAMGIAPGDRVAIVGLNSTRYLVLDVAIGLAGAVSVPLYYTSPPADMDSILETSGARLLFIGAPQLLERLGELQAGLPVVSFCRPPLPAHLPRPVTSWDEFLSRGAGCEAAAAPVGFGDLATLRYSSGTTGTPKGVMYQHQHLRWMGECMASLLPWRARNRPAAWLSCLPMNHVVEGILATYAPYYVPAPVEITFLENIRDMGRTLPQVRPTVFFSVPRVYEKVWDSLAKSRAGRFYLGLQEGVLRPALRPALRLAACAALRPLLCWSMLRKAGFDHCVQLIVGSAPAGEGLLRAFHELGIEIHNAYGLTEAPLVTMNRLRANRIGTVGTPLPNTEIRIAPDGEIMVRGPQVTAGYYGEAMASPFQDGWLCTGDLGTLTDEGSLVILGRKKELIKTSYAKYVYPAKVEALLQEIPGVAEAMLVGEGRPYCVALLWPAAGCDRVLAASIDRAIAEVNTHLSHPEQVKRWAILANDLSVEGGELTANLKLKRQVVARRFRSVVEAMYAGAVAPGGAVASGRAVAPGDGEAPSGVLHLGQAEQ